MTARPGWGDFPGTRLGPASPVDFDAIDAAWYAAGHSNEACGGYRFEPHNDPAKSLIRCACEGVIPLPLDEVMDAGGLPGEERRAAA